MLTDSQIESIKVARLEPGDVVVLKCPQVISKDASGRMVEMVTRLLPSGVKALVLDGGLDLQVLRPEAAEAALLIEAVIRDGNPVAEALQRTYGLQRQGR